MSRFAASRPASLRAARRARLCLAGAAALALLLGTPGAFAKRDPADEDVPEGERRANDEAPRAREPRPAPPSDAPRLDRLPRPKPRPVEARPAETRPISEIRIEGLQRVEVESVRPVLQSEIGRPPDVGVLREDVRRLHGLNAFTSVVVEKQPATDGGLVLVFRLEERPSIRQVLIEGNDKLADGDLEKVIDLKPSEMIDERRLEQNAEKLRVLYRQQGFHYTDVEWELRPIDASPLKEPDPLVDLATKAINFITPDAPPKRRRPDEAPKLKLKAGGENVDVVLRVREGSKVKVEEVAFTGNESISADELSEAIRTKKDVPLAELLGWGLYRDELLRMDLLAIQALYQERGFLEVKVGKPEVKLSPDKQRARITIPIEEGDSYRVGRVRVAGDLVVDDPASADGREEIVFERDALRSRLGFTTGDVAVRSRLAEGVNGVADMYRNRGYAYVNVSPDISADVENDTLDVTVEIDAGPRVLVERIEIAGNTKTRDEVIRRELRVYEGEWYSAEKLRRSEERVRALGYFSKVNVTTRKSEEAGRMVVVVDVEEKNTGMFQLGAGFSSAESFSVTGQIAYDNFLGSGTSMAAAAAFSSLRRQFDVLVADPYFLMVGQEPISASFHVYNTQTGFSGFIRDALGGSLRLGYPIGRPFAPLTERLGEGAPRWLRPYVPDLENLHFYVAGTVERIRLETGEVFKGWDVFDVNKPRYTTGIEAALVFDQRNNRLFPSSGYYFDARMELASPQLGAAYLPGLERAAKDALAKGPFPGLADALTDSAVANDFQRFSMNGRFYLTFDEWLPVRGIVAKANLSVGYLKSSTLMPFENYYLGGIISGVRGYYTRSISPVVRVPGERPGDPARLVPVGGNKEIYTNLELEFPVLEPLGIRGVLFFDAGNVYGEGENFFYLGNRPTEPDDRFDPRRDLPLGVYSSVGFGIRWFSPIGPLRFEWGIPLTPRPSGTPSLPRGDQPLMFEFSMGSNF